MRMKWATSLRAMNHAEVRNDGVSVAMSVRPEPATGLPVADDKRRKRRRADRERRNPERPNIDRTEENVLQPRNCQTIRRPPSDALHPGGHDLERKERAADHHQR